VGVGRPAAHPVADAVLRGGVLHPRVAAAGAQSAGRPVGGVVEAGGVVAAAVAAAAAGVLRPQRGLAGGLLRWRRQLSACRQAAAGNEGRQVQVPYLWRGVNVTASAPTPQCARQRHVSLTLHATVHSVTADTPVLCSLLQGS
jgi:hypothetical protein